MSNLLMGDDMEQRIIKELCQQAGVFLSAEELSSKLGVNQGFFLEKIDKLKEQGYDILVDSGYRYCLQLAENIILPEDIPKNLRSNLIGKELCFFPRLASSNETARDYFIKGLIGEGAVIAAAVQTGGKGRKGRSWESPAGGLWFSVLFRPYLSIEKTALLSLVFAVAVAAALDNFLPEPTELKWPNDVYARGKKIAGILLQGSGGMEGFEYLIVGIGINVNIEEGLLEKAGLHAATSILQLSGKVLRPGNVLNHVLISLDYYYSNFLEQGFSGILDEFKKRCFHLNKMIEIETAGGVIRGQNIDINENGDLLLKSDNEIKRIRTGDVNLLD